MFFNMNKINTKIALNNVKKVVPGIVRKYCIDIETSDLPDLKTFQRSEGHIDVITYG